MANSSQGDQNARTIIIPKGVLDPNQVNVINIPRKMNTTAPLLVTPRKDGGGFKSQTLPIWRDELSGPGKFPTGLKVKQKACSSNKGNDSTLSSMYDSSAEMDANSSGFIQNIGTGQYNIIKPMTPSPERPWPKLQEHRGGRGFMPRHMSSPQGGVNVNQSLMNDSTLPSTMYSQDFIDPDMSGMQEMSASSKSSGTESDCVCASDEDVSATFDEIQNPNATFDRSQNPNATFDRPQNPNATFDRSQNPNATFDRPQNPNATYDRPQNPNATFDRPQLPQNPNATYNQSPRFNSTFNQPQNPNATFNRSQQQNATYDRPQDSETEDCICPHGGDGSSFNQRQNQNQSYGQYGEQYQQPAFCEDPNFVCPTDDTFDVPFGEQYQPNFGNETYNAPPSNQMSADSRGYQPSSYRTSPASPQNTSCGGQSVCSNLEEDPYAPRILHMSSRTFTQVNDNPPESQSIIVDAPAGVDEHALKYATQLATYGGDSGPRANQTYSSPPTPRSGSPPSPRGGSPRGNQPSNYRTSPATSGTISSGAPPSPRGAGNSYQVCSNMEEDPYSPRILHMSSRTFSQVDDNPPESQTITVEAPSGVDERALRYATQMATYGDSGPRTDDSYFADQSYSSPSPPRGGRQVQPSRMGTTGYGIQEHAASPMYPSGGFGQQYGFQEHGLDNSNVSGCSQQCYEMSRTR